MTFFEQVPMLNISSISICAFLKSTKVLYKSVVTIVSYYSQIESTNATKFSFIDGAEHRAYTGPDIDNNCLNLLRKRLSSVYDF